jgi:hypothetical protein
MHHRLPDAYPTERRALQVVTTHVIARRLHAATGRFGLRATPGGFGTPQFETSDAGRERLRVAGGRLVRERLDPSATTTSMPIDGSTLLELAAFAGVEFTGDGNDEFSVGHDTPSLGDVERPIAVSDGTIRAIGDWFGVAVRALDAVAGAVSDPRATPTVAQIWPEHFDVAFDLAFAPDAAETRRVNLGGAVGDGFEPGPYLYVGPWTDDRPGDTEFWNAPFGAVLRRDDVLAGDDPVAAATEFFQHGLTLLSSAE